MNHHNLLKLSPLMMPTRIKISLSTFLLIFSLYSQTDTQNLRYELIQRYVLGLTKNHHYKKEAIENIDYVNNVFKKYIESLDYNKELFLQQDIEKLETFKPGFVSNLQKSDLTFFLLADSIYRERLRTYKVYTYDILSKPFSYNQKQYHNTEIEKINFCKTTKEQKKRWYKTLKWYTLDHYYNSLKTQEKLLAQPSNEEKPVAARKGADIEQEARKITLKNMKDRFDYLEKQSADERYAIYINAILGVYDPHTSYFPPKEKEEFDIRMTGQFEGIGAVLQKTEGNIKVVRIMPGGAAERQKELKAGDVILKVAQENQKPVSIINMSLRDAVSLIRGKKHSIVTLTVEKIDGTIKDIAIKRDVVILENSHVKYTMIQDKSTGLKYGYIRVPAFYHDFSKDQNRGGFRVSEDMKKAINVLQEKRIDGLIVDLQNNGGGSLTEAIEVSGLFVKGPVVQAKRRNAPPQVHFPRNNKAPIYEGPMVVVVNRNSASASEIFAAAIQDHKRGIIIGAAKSYGKGTVQQLINLDNAIPYQKLAPFGALKITLEKFYRVNGQTTQHIGVKPDIILPDLYTHIDVGESTYEYALKADTIESVLDNQPHYDLKQRDYIFQNSLRRVQKNKTFGSINETANLLKERRSKFQHTLNYADLKKEKEQLKNINYNFKDKEDKNLAIIPVMNTDKVEKDQLVFVEEWSKNTLTNPYLREALYVLRDYHSQ